MRLLLFALLVFPLCLCAQPGRIKPPTKPTPTPAPTTTTPVKPRPTTGTLSITSTPSDVSVKIDGEYIGNTPLTLKNRKPGTYRITFSAEGYESNTQSVTVTAGKTATCSATLKKKQAQQPVSQQPASTSPSSASSQTFTANGVTFKMIKVEGGTFQMGGSPEQGRDVEDYEMPVHSVSLNSYYIGQTEVTQALWTAVMGSNPSYNRGSSLPVERVSWEDCQTFITKLNQLTGQKFRLPTEAEWEYAARGGKQSKGYKYSGSNTLEEIAWYGSNSDNKTHPVAMKKANELGIYDMSGNVREWCQDWYDKNYYKNSLSRNPSGPTTGTYRVYRDGCWSGKDWFCRVSNRGCENPSVRHYYNLGLRLATGSSESITHSPKVLDLGYARWTGGVKNGKPDGVGKMKFTRAHRLDSQTMAEEGDEFEGSYTNGQIDAGKLHRTNGEIITIIGEN